MNKKIRIRCSRIIGEYLLVISLILLTASLMMFFQLKHHVGLILSDTLFHENRIYDTAQQLLHHNFSYFQMNYGAYQSGRIINPIYGPFFSYFLGGLLLLAGSWFRFQVLTNYLLFILAGLGMYRLSKKVKASNWAAILSMLMFLATGYVVYWIQGDTFNSWGAALMPYVLIEGIKMIQTKDRQVNWLELGTVMGIIAQVHMLSIVLSVMALIPFFVYGLIISENKKELLINVGKAILLFVVLSANVWSAYLLLYSTNTISPTFSYPLAQSAVHLGAITVKGTILISTLLVFIFQLGYVFFCWKNQPINLFLTVEGFVFLIISSQLFPWQLLERQLPSLATYLQFPNRLTVIAYPLLYSGIAISLTHLLNNKNWGIKSIGIVGSCLILLTFAYNTRSNMIKNEQQTMGIVATTHIAKWSRQPDLNQFLINVPSFNPEYLSLRHKITMARANMMLYQKLYIPNRDHFHKEVLAHGKLKIIWQGDEKLKDVLLPIVMYHQSQLVVNGKDKGQIKEFNAIGMPVVRSKVGQNEAILSFNIPKWFMTLLFVSIISWLIVIVFSICQFSKSRLKSK
ncbi:cell division protein [Lactobacillus sp. PV034]|uniref:cell division protein n=1 Tax=Lactobacillus sp. PV034 TaxID=2594495 RepID=UPI0022403317|nr:cell division protein [Lactobacillus sp. PV034]QNQ80996.1 cell division protein [Lactobacillus sp. PV034]